VVREQIIKLALDASERRECAPITAPARHGREIRPINGEKGQELGLCNKL
jgi:hypothetical protein